MTGPSAAIEGTRLHRSPFGQCPAGCALVLSLFLLGACGKLPDNNQGVPSHAIVDGDSTTLGKEIRARLRQHPALSGVHLLINGLDAFVARTALARLAERTIDVQYYMFHQDTVGRLLIRELLAAADRGVRVRMLIDDVYGEEGDAVWSALDAHPNVEVRLFNPFVRGRSKDLQLVTRFKTVNHRMHSKTFTVDNQVSIVGGRNIGDEYFDADPNLAFTDVDVAAIGPVVPEVSQEFDQYWNSEPAYPVATLMPAAREGALGKLRSDLAAFYRQKQTSVYLSALENSAFAGSLKRKMVQASFAEAKVIHDSPEKLARGEDWKEELLMSQLAPYIQQATVEFVLVSPYFVPGQRAADALCGLSRKGVRVRILTNSLASNDVPAVHAGYMRHREQLLRCGVQLYELNEQLKKQEAKQFTWLPGLSKSSLHAKAMAIDRKAMFVGSFNFDQRSLYLNNEIGILFHEPQLAASTVANFNERVAKVAFKVELAAGKLRWTGTNDGKEVVFSSEPYVGFWEILGVNAMRLLPIYSML
jgi:cardiolipin synthase C